MSRNTLPPLIQRASGKRRKRGGLFRWLRRLLLLLILWLCGVAAGKLLLHTYTILLVS